MHFPGGIQLMFILAVALLVFGPNKMPEIARSMGKAMSEFKNAMRDVTDHLDINAISQETRVHSGTEHALSSAQPVRSSYADSYTTGQQTGYHPESYVDHDAQVGNTGSNAGGSDAGENQPVNESLAIG
ncbi:MAG TPA: twin-arginine translocase TatA/TatE family subunit [Armatimonadota bacterium]|nr:twin-arginine translocase TatA/TatE family subunit [Armatimonadota bacterium]